MGEDAVTNLQTIRAKGESQYDSYISECLDRQVTPVSDIIGRNNMAIFARCQYPNSQEHRMKLFGRMYISCQIRDGDMDAFLVMKTKKHHLPGLTWET